jgi:hypothetical protein
VASDSSRTAPSSPYGLALFTVRLGDAICRLRRISDPAELSERRGEHRYGKGCDHHFQRISHGIDPDGRLRIGTVACAASPTYSSSASSC